MAGAQAPPTEPASGIYILEQTFKVPGTAETRRRTGFVARMKVEAFGNNVFRCQHADTNVQDSEPLLVLYDGEAELTISGKLVVSRRDGNGTDNKLWAVAEGAAVDSMLDRVQGEKLVIAHGVERYEAALARGEQSITAVFVSWNDSGLVALPLHRVVQEKPDYSTGVLVMNSRAYFFFQDVSRTMPPMHGIGPRFDEEIAKELLRPVCLASVENSAAAKSAEEAGARVSPGAARNSQVEAGDVAMLAITSKQTFRLHSKPGWADSILAHVPQTERNIDVTQLHRIILEGVLELPEAALREGKYISYHRDSEEAVRRVQEGANVAFILSSPRLEKLREVALSGGVLPQRSVEFYPPLAGLQIDALE